VLHQGLRLTLRTPSHTGAPIAIHQRDRRFRTPVDARAIAIGNFDGVHLAIAAVRRGQASARALVARWARSPSSRHPRGCSRPSTLRRSSTRRGGSSSCSPAPEWRSGRPAVRPAFAPPNRIASSSCSPAPVPPRWWSARTSLRAGARRHGGDAPGGPSAARRAAAGGSPITVNGLVVSSNQDPRVPPSRVRVEAAAQLLGRPFDLKATWCAARARAEAGLSDANIRTDAELLPAVGVYAVRPADRIRGADLVLDVRSARLGRPLRRSETSASIPPFATTRTRQRARAADARGAPFRRKPRPLRPFLCASSSSTACGTSAGSETSRRSRSDRAQTSPGAPSRRVGKGAALGL